MGDPHSKGVSMMQITPKKSPTKLLQSTKRYNYLYSEMKSKLYNGLAFITISPEALTLRNVALMYPNGWFSSKKLLDWNRNYYNSRLLVSYEVHTKLLNHSCLLLPSPLKPTVTRNNMALDCTPSG